MSETFESIDLPDGRRLSHLVGGDVTGYPFSDFTARLAVD